MKRRCAGLVLIALWAAPVGTALADYHDAEKGAQEELEAAEGHAESHGGQLHLSDVNWLDMAGYFLNFGVLVAILAWVIRKQGNPALAARRAEVEKELAEAQRLRAEAEARHRETAGRLERLDEEMAQIRADMIKAGEVERDRIVEQAEEKAARMRRDASFLIEQNIKQLRGELSHQAANAAVLAAQELLRERTTDADQDNLAEAYLNRLDELIQERGS